MPDLWSSNTPAVLRRALESYEEVVAAQGVAGLPELGKVAWTLGYYARYAEALRDHARDLGGDWTPVKLERALWAHSGGKARR